MIRRTGHAVVGVKPRRAHELGDLPARCLRARRRLPALAHPPRSRHRPRDAIDPFRGGVFPRAAARALLRAGPRRCRAITRTARAARIRFNREIRRHNATVPVFLARTAAGPPPVTEAGAFCDFGRPRLPPHTRDLGVEPLFRDVPDHHHYRPARFPWLAARLATTEKGRSTSTAVAASTACRAHAHGHRRRSAMAL